MRPIYRRTPGDWLADLGATLMIILLAIVCVVLLSGCASPGMAGLSPRVYSSPLEIDEIDMAARFKLFRTPDEVTSWCNGKGIRIPPIGSFTTGCAIRPMSLHNPLDRWLICVVQPTSWNDRESLANLGHEVVHTLGGTHE